MSAPNNTSTSRRVVMTRSKIAELQAALGGGSTNSNNKDLFSSTSDSSFNTSSKHDNNNLSSMTTSSSTSSLNQSGLSSSSKKPLAIRCVCGKRQLSSSSSQQQNNSSNNNSSVNQQQGDIIECRKCHFGLHATCVGLTRPERFSTKSEREAAALLVDTFVCDVCLKESGGKIGGVKILMSSTLQHQASSSNTSSSKKRAASANKTTTRTKGGSSSPSSSWRKRTQAQLNAAVEEEELSPEEELAKIHSVHETADRTILNQQPYRNIISNATEFLDKAGFSLITFPISGNNGGSSTNSSSSPPLLSVSEIEDQVMESSRSSIEDATFSEEYPLYCIRELQSNKHPYLQGAAAFCKKTKKIVAIVMSNGRDPYCDLKPTVQNLRRQITNGKVKLLSTPQEESKYASKFLMNNINNNNNNNNSSSKRTLSLNSSAAPGSRIRQRTTSSSSSSGLATVKEASSSSSSFSSSVLTSVTTDPSSSSSVSKDGQNNNTILMRASAAKFAKECLLFNDFDSVVHFTYIVTHEDYRGKKLAKTLMWIELARWALRGRKNACVNMALEKVYHNNNNSTSSSTKNDAGNNVISKHDFIVDHDDEVDADGNNIHQQQQVQQQQDAAHHHNHQDAALKISPRNSSSNNNNASLGLPHARAMSNAVAHQNAKKIMTNSISASKKNNNNKQLTSVKRQLSPQRSDNDEEEDDDTFLECRVTEASRRLYSGLTFHEVFPRYGTNGNLRWTRKEENAGRMMLSIDFPAAMIGGGVGCPFL